MLRQFVRSAHTVTVATFISGNLSVTLFLPVIPNDSKRALNFLLFACLFVRLFIRAKFLFACSMANLNHSFTDNEYFASTATVKRSHQSSQSVLGAVSAESQYVGNPDTADSLPDFATSQLLAESRSRML